MSPILLLVIALGFLPESLFGLLAGGATNADVYLELIKTIGIGISAGASCFALWIAHRNQKQGARIERKVERRRREVRREDTPMGEATNVVIKETPERRKRER